MSKTIQLTDPLSQLPVRLILRRGETELAIGSGMMMRSESELCLLTARHNVTGRHAESGKPLHTTAALPDNVVVYTWNQGVDRGSWSAGSLPLFDDHGIPFWYEHPLYGARVDAVAIPVVLQGDTKAFPVNEMLLEMVPLSPGLDVYTIGFPKGMGGGGHLPIWKRGSLATEPNVDIDDLPKVLIDTATREGMSGAPVIVQINGLWMPVGATTQGEQVIGRGRAFLGLYSGRVGDDEFQAQLGIVWKASCLSEIARGQVRASTPLNL